MAEEKKKAAEVTAAAEVAEPADDGRKDIFIPRGPKNDDPNLFVSVNGKNYLLPRGKKSRVPKAVADEIERSGRAADIFYENVDGMKNTGN